MNEELKNIIQKSGNNLHMQVSGLLENAGWEVEISSYYYDDTTNKPREIDLIARKKFFTHDMFGREVSHFYVCLFIECKYFKNDIAFWMQEANKNKIFEAIILDGFNKDEVFGNNYNHHYFSVVNSTSKKLAKLFETKDQNEIFEAITRPVKSLVFFREHNLKLNGFYYPFVIYDGIPGFYLIKNNDDIKNMDNLEQVKNVILDFNYSYRNPVSYKLKSQFFCVDFINKKEILDYLDMIEKEEIFALRSQINFRARQEGIS